MRRGGGVSGAVSLVMIFCVLCLSVFAVLTLSTAVREEKLTSMAAQSAADYCEADRQAVEVVAALRDGRALPMDMEVQRVSAGYSDGAEETAAFSVPFGEDQELQVEVLLGDKDGKTFKILRWQTVYTGQWQPDEFMDLWGGF